MSYLKPSKSSIAGLVFFPLFFLFVYIWANPELTYFSSEYFHFARMDTYSGLYISDAPPYPGKLADRAASFLVQYFSARAIGALIVTTIALALSITAGGLLRLFGAPFLMPLRYAPAIILLLGCVTLAHFFRDSVSMLIGVAAALACCFIRFRRTWPSAALFGACSVLVYYSAVQSYLIFMVVCLSFEAFVARRGRMVFAELIIGALAPGLLAYALFNVYSVEGAYALLWRDFHYPGQTSVSLLNSLFFLMYPLLIVFSFAARRWGRRFSASASSFASNRFPAFCANTYVQGLALGVCLSVGAGVWAKLLASDSLLRTDARIQCAMQKKDWNAVLQAAETIPKDGFKLYHSEAVNIARYHTNTLLSDLLRFPQFARIPLFIFGASAYSDKTPQADKYHLLTHLVGAEAILELGCINNVEDRMYEALSGTFYCPQALQLLAKVYLAKDMPSSAAIFLRALCKDRNYRAWAKRYLSVLESGSSLAAIPEIRELRSRMLRNDGIGYSNQSYLESLVAHNPSNRMAFEFLCASHLLNLHLDSLAKNVKLLRDLQYESIPRLYEEALILHEEISGGPVELHGYSISPEAREAYDAIGAIIEKYGFKNPATRQEIAKRFPKSFYYYWMSNSY